MTVCLTFHVVVIVTASRTWTIVVPDGEIAKVMGKLGAPVATISLVTQNCEGAWQGHIDEDQADFICRQHRLPISITVMGQRS